MLNYSSLIESLKDPLFALGLSDDVVLALHKRSILTHDSFPSHIILNPTLASQLLSSTYLFPPRPTLNVPPTVSEFISLFPSFANRETHQRYRSFVGIAYTKSLVNDLSSICDRTLSSIFSSCNQQDFLGASSTLSLDINLAILGLEGLRPLLAPLLPYFAKIFARPLAEHYSLDLTALEAYNEHVSVLLSLSPAAPMRPSFMDSLTGLDRQTAAAWLFYTILSGSDSLASMISVALYYKSRPDEWNSILPGQDFSADLLLRKLPYFRLLVRSVSSNVRFDRFSFSAHSLLFFPVQILNWFDSHGHGLSFGAFEYNCLGRHLVPRLLSLLHQSPDDPRRVPLPSCVFAHDYASTRLQYL